jgi:hypothetical protein
MGDNIVKLLPLRIQSDLAKHLFIVLTVQLTERGIIYVIGIKLDGRRQLQLERFEVERTRVWWVLSANTSLESLSRFAVFGMFARCLACGSAPTAVDCVAANTQTPINSTISAGLAEEVRQQVAGCGEILYTCEYNEWKVFIGWTAVEKTQCLLLGMCG